MTWDTPGSTLEKDEYANLVEAVKQPVHVGRVVLTSTGKHHVTGVGFQPSMVQFRAEAVGQNVDRGSTQNTSQPEAYAGSMTGFARDDGTRQFVHSGMSSNSVNASSHYSGDNAAIGIRYADENGNETGKLTADVSSFESDGFTVDVSQFTRETVVIYTAYR